MAPLTQRSLRLCAALATCALPAQSLPSADVAPHSSAAAGSRQAALPVAALPTRAVAILTETEYCLDTAPAQVRAQCFEQVASALQSGLLYQRCLWSVASPEQCPGITPLPALGPAASEQRAALLAGAELMVAALRDPASQSSPATRAMLQKLREFAARNIAAERGQYTLISQGGVSLGSWQAGYTYFLTEVLKERRTRLAVAGLLPRSSPAAATATGASAGAINALISGMEGCRAEPARAKDSLFFRIWIETLGLTRRDGGGLFDLEGSGESLALFSRQPLDSAVALAKEYAERSSFLPGCTFDLGFVATHLEPAPTPVHTDQTGQRVLVKAPRLTERFSFRVTLDEQRAPAVTALPALPQNVSGVPDNVFYAHLGRGQQPTFDEVLAGVRASGAFPVAFPPVPLCYRVYDACSGNYLPGKVEPFTSGKKPAQVCAASAAASSVRATVKASAPKTAAGKPANCPAAAPGYWVPELFVDGGTLDNTPIRLAATINGWRDPVAPNPWFTDLVLDPNTYVFVNPGVLGWEPHAPVEPKEEEGEPEPDSLLGTYLAFAGQLLSSGFDAQLLNTAEQLSFIRQESANWNTPRMEVPRRNSPIAGEQLAHFMAFFERDFRVYDFYVGVADAITHVTERFPNLAPFAGSVRDRLADDWEHRCMSAYYAARYKFTQPLAHAKEMFADTAFSACADAPGLDSDVRASRDNFRAMIAGLHNYQLWTLSDKHKPEKALSQFLGELEQQKFQFTDTQVLGEGNDLSQAPRKFFRRLLQRAIDQLAHKHDFPQSMLFSDGGRLAADALVYRDFASWSLSAGFAANGPELGAQRLIVSGGDWWSARFDVRGRAYRWGREPLTPNTRMYTSMQEASAGLTNVVGLPFFNPGMLDLELHAGLGWYHVYSWSDGQSVRSAPFYVLGGQLVVLQHVYLGLEHQVDVNFENYLDERYRGSLVDTLWNRKRWAGAVGWRWLL